MKRIFVQKLFGGIIKLIKIFQKLDFYLDQRNKSEIFMLYGVFIILGFFAIFFWFLPPIDENLENEKSSYIKISTSLKQNEVKLKNLVSKQTFEENDNLKMLKIKNNYEILDFINQNAKGLSIKIFPDVKNTKKEIYLKLEGSFEDVIELMRLIEQNPLIFIEDALLFPSENKIMAELKIKNLGEMI